MDKIKMSETDLHAHWEKLHTGASVGFYCSNCYHQEMFDSNNYCCNCGAKMDEGGEAK